MLRRFADREGKRMEKENQRVALSKRLLKDAVLGLLKKKHISGISVSELCREAQINRTTFYRHYQTPHDVLLEIEMDFVKEFPLDLGSARDAMDLRVQLVGMCNFLFDHQELVKLFISNNMDRDFISVFRNVADGFLEDRTIRYKGRRADEETMRLMSTFFASGGYSLIRQWLMEGIQKTPDEIADLISGSFNRDVTFV